MVDRTLDDDQPSGSGPVPNTGLQTPCNPEPIAPCVSPCDKSMSPEDILYAYGDVSSDTIVHRSSLQKKKKPCKTPCTSKIDPITRFDDSTDGTGGGSIKKETLKRVPTPAPTTPEPTPSPTYPPHGEFQRIKIKHEKIEKYRIVHGSVAREPTAMPVEVPHDSLTKMPTPMPTISSEEFEESIKSRVYQGTEEVIEGYEDTLPCYSRKHHHHHHKSRQKQPCPPGQVLPQPAVPCGQYGYAQVDYASLMARQHQNAPQYVSSVPCPPGQPIAPAPIPVPVPCPPADGRDLGEDTNNSSAIPALSLGLLVMLMFL